MAISHLSCSAGHKSWTQQSTPPTVAALTRVASSRFVPVVPVFVCVAGAQQEIEPFSRPLPRPKQTSSEPPTRYTKAYYTAAAKAVAHTYHWKACAPRFLLATPPRKSSKPHSEGEPCIMHRSYHTSNERGFWWIGVGMASFLQKLSRFCSMNTTCPSVSQTSEIAASAVPLRRSSFNAAMMDPSLSSRRHLRECSCRRRHSRGLVSVRACVRACVRAFMREFSG